LEAPLQHVIQFTADALERLSLIFLENAVKYTPSGGHVDVRLKSQDSIAITEIRDSRIGIAANDIPHIFERFCQADPSRSRENGGRGLGLADRPMDCANTWWRHRR
jgi:signal transduction histidine kinase